VLHDFILECLTVRGRGATASILEYCPHAARVAGDAGSAVSRAPGLDLPLKKRRIVRIRTIDIARELFRT
jgi:hypothetical protein